MKPRTRPASKTLCPVPSHGPKALAFPLWAIESEADFQAKVLQMATNMGWLCYHTWGSVHSARGFPDLVMVGAGRLVFAELKTIDGKLSADQERWQEELGHVGLHGGFSVVWRPCDFEEIEDVLR